jgi:hypothetical protein
VAFGEFVGGPVDAGCNQGLPHPRHVYL